MGKMKKYLVVKGNEKQRLEKYKDIFLEASKSIMAILDNIGEEEMAVTLESKVKQILNMLDKAK